MKNWTDEEKQTWNTAISSITILGAAVGALFSGSFTKYGKKRMIQVINVILLFSIGVCMINNIYVIAVGRFFWGLCAGSYSVFCPKYLSEFIPIELRGTYGGIPQFMVCFGISIPACMSIALEEHPAEAYKNNPDDFYINEYWRVIWAVPAIIAILHTMLLLFCFRFETPFDLKQAGKD